MASSLLQRLDADRIRVSGLRQSELRKKLEASDTRFTVAVPADKSLTHRAIILAGLAHDTSTIRNALESDDCRATLRAMQSLGARYRSTRAGEYSVEPNGPLVSPIIPIDCGNSGTTSRLLAGLISGQPDLFACLYGDASLSARPMLRVVEPLRTVGARIEGRAGASLMPLAILGQQLNFSSRLLDISVASGQVKSAFMLAGLFGNRSVHLRLPVGARRHTEVMLRWMGVKVHSQVAGNFEEILMEPCSNLSGQDFRIPGDPSSAAFLAVLAVLHPGMRLCIPEVLASPERIGFYEVLREMGAKIEMQAPSSAATYCGEEVRDLYIDCSAPLRGVTVAAEVVPTLIDEIPLLAIAASRAQGKTKILGCKELRVKESDRLAKTVELLRKAGVSVTADDDSIEIEGGSQDAPISAIVYDGGLDHRMVMSAVILATAADEPSTIGGSAAVSVSFPGFVETIDGIYQRSKITRSV